MALTDLASLSGVLCPIRPSAETCPIPFLRRASSWLWFVPLASNSARGKTEDSCIAFSSTVICRSSFSARSMALTEGARAAGGASSSSVAGDTLEDSPGNGPLTDRGGALCPVLGGAARSSDIFSDCFGVGIVHLTAADRRDSHDDPKWSFEIALCHFGRSR